MQNAFTVHCITWQAGSPLLQEVRSAASNMGLMAQGEAHADQWDEQARHALVLSKSGTAIGCARLSPDGRIDRMVVLPHEHRELIEAALIEMLNDYVEQIKAAPVPAKNINRIQAV